MTKWLYKMEYKFRRFGVDNLMLYITGTMLAVYLAEGLTRGMTQMPISDYLTLNRALLFKGEIWRLVTFIFVPPNNTMLWAFLAMYFYYFIGTSLENTWGRAKFNMFYLFGVIGAIVAALITGRGDNMYLNLSMFLAFAALYPDHQVMLFFVIPIKVKILAYIDLVVLLLSFVAGGWYIRAAILASFVNLLIFFGDDFIDKVKNFKKYYRQRRNYRKSMRRGRDMYGR